MPGEKGLKGIDSGVVISMCQVDSKQMCLMYSSQRWMGRVNVNMGKVM
jgi:hypothetical protein